MHEWMLDNGFTPHIVVDAKREGVRIPEAHVKDGKIVSGKEHFFDLYNWDQFWS